MACFGRCNRNRCGDNDDVTMTIVRAATDEDNTVVLRCVCGNSCGCGCNGTASAGSCSRCGNNYVTNADCNCSSVESGSDPCGCGGCCSCGN